MDENFKHIPFRLYRDKHRPIQCLVRPTLDDGRERILEDLLQDVLKDIYDKGWYLALINDFKYSFIIK